jgi:hypothetical protein
MRCVVLSFVSVTKQSWTADQDYLLQYVQTAGSVAAVVSENPSLAATDLKAPSADNIRNDIYAWLGVDAGTAETRPGAELKIPVMAGSKVWVAVSATSSVLLYLEPMVPS